MFKKTRKSILISIIGNSYSKDKSYPDIKMNYKAMSKGLSQTVFTIETTTSIFHAPFISKIISSTILNEIGTTKQTTRYRFFVHQRLSLLKLVYLFPFLSPISALVPNLGRILPRPYGLVVKAENSLVEGRYFIEPVCEPQTFC